MTLTLNKSIPAVRLHPRTGAPTTDAEVTIPFGAILEFLGRDRDFDKYRYMGENYRSAHDEFVSATNYALVKEEKTAEASTQETAAASTPAVEAGPSLKFEAVPSNVAGLKRAAVPGGWLVAFGNGLTFLPDAGHMWDGVSDPRAG